MMAAVPVMKGDRIRAVGGIGGGYGKAFERDPERVRDDFLDGYLTADSAAQDFGVVLTADGAIDQTATRKMRAAEVP